MNEIKRTEKQVKELKKNLRKMDIGALLSYFEQYESDSFLWSIEGKSFVKEEIERRLKNAR